MIHIIIDVFSTFLKGKREFSGKKSKKKYGHPTFAPQCSPDRALSNFQHV